MLSRHLSDILRSTRPTPRKKIQGKSRECFPPHTTLEKFENGVSLNIRMQVNKDVFSVGEIGRRASRLAGSHAVMR